MLAWCIEMGASILRNPFWSWQLERHFSKPKQIMFMDASLGNFQIPKLVQHDIQLGTYSTSVLTAHTTLPSAQGSTCLQIQTTLIISLQNFEYFLTLRTSITSTQVLAKYALRIQNNSPARRCLIFIPSC